MHTTVCFMSLYLFKKKPSCEECGEVHERDVNAAINLRNYAVRALTAGGEDVRPIALAIGNLC